jgi:hypothetical protein
MIIRCGGPLVGLPGVAVGSLPLPSVPSGQHVGDPGLGVRWLRFMGHRVVEPLPRRSVGAHSNVAHYAGVSSKTREAVAGFAQDGNVALVIHMYNLRRLGDVGRSGRQRALDLGRCRFAGLR